MHSAVCTKWGCSGRRLGAARYARTQQQIFIFVQNRLTVVDKLAVLKVDVGVMRSISIFRRLSGPRCACACSVMYKKQELIFIVL